MVNFTSSEIKNTARVRFSVKTLDFTLTGTEITLMEPSVTVMGLRPIPVIFK